jgi:hypothetical protein
LHEPSRSNLNCTPTMFGARGMQVSLGALLNETFGGDLPTHWRTIFSSPQMLFDWRRVKTFRHAYGGLIRRACISWAMATGSTATGLDGEVHLLILFGRMSRRCCTH